MQIDYGTLAHVIDTLAKLEASLEKLYTEDAGKQTDTFRIALIAGQVSSTHNLLKSLRDDSLIPTAD